jgi:hypothetical protein
MKKRFALGLMVAALIPAALFAQSSGAMVLQGSVEQRDTLPVTLDFSAPADARWLAKVNADATTSAYSPVSSKAESALSAAVNSPVSGDAPAAMPVAPPVSSAQAVLTSNCGGECCHGGCNNGLETPTQFGVIDKVISRFRGPTGPVREWLRDFCPNVFHKGEVSFEYGTQYWNSPIFLASANAAQMLPEILRIGYMLNDPCKDRTLKGCFEVLGEFEAIPITSGAGTFMVGGSGLIRYHRARNHRIVPYFQVGFGGLYTDSAGLAGSPTTTNFNFITQIGMGSHIFLGQSGKWAIMNESSYTFIGNWGIGQGNGYHILGGLVGITRYFGAPNSN